MTSIGDFINLNDLTQTTPNNFEPQSYRFDGAETSQSETFSDKVLDTSKKMIPLFDQVNQLGGKIILDFDNTIDIDSDYNLGETAADWLNEMAESGVDAYLVTGNGNQEKVTEAIVSGVYPENRAYWSNLLENKAFYGAGDKSDEYQQIIGDSDGSQWMLVDDSSKNVKDFLEETGNQGFVYEPNSGYANYNEFNEHLEGFVEQLSGQTNSSNNNDNNDSSGTNGSSGSKPIDSWYEKHNDEAAKGRDNEMSKREVKAFTKDSSLSEEEKKIADFVYDNRKRFDVDGNGRLSREEFHNAVNAASGSNSSGPTDAGSQSQRVNELYERHNDEAAKGRDNEMSKREVDSLRKDRSLSSSERDAAEYIYDNRKLFDTDSNGRLSREEFLKAYDAAISGKTVDEPTTAKPPSNEAPSNPASPSPSDPAGSNLNGDGEVGSLNGSKKIKFTADKDVTLVVAVNASHGQDSDSDKLPTISGLGKTYSAGNNDIGVSVSTITLSKGESVTFTMDTKGGKGAYMVDTIDGHYKVTDDKSKKDGSWGLSAGDRGDLYGYFGAYDDGATSSSAREAQQDGFELKNGGDVLIWKVGKDHTMDPDLISNEGKGSGGNKGQLMLTFDKA